MPQFSRFSVPTYRFRSVFGNAPPVVVANTEIGLGLRVALFGCSAVPARCLRGVASDTLTPLIADPKIILGLCVALLGCFPKPSYGLEIVLANAVTVAIAEAESALCRRVSMLCPCTDFLKSLHVHIVVGPLGEQVDRTARH